MKKTQTSEIKKYIENHPNNGLTSKQAIEKFGAYRLSDVIYRLRRHPYNMNIQTVTKIEKNRYGGLSHVACYKIVD